MMRRIPHLKLSLLLSAWLGTILTFSYSITFGQDNPIPRTKVSSIDLLTLDGSKPELTQAGEGITSIKTTLLFKPGLTQVKPFDGSFKIELPVGYTLFNNLAYTIGSQAIFSGPNDFVLRIPSATNSESFGSLRILYADYDNAVPEKPRWVDATVRPESYPYWERYLSSTEFEKLQPDFKSRTLHALMEAAPRIFVIAKKDLSIARDRFVADLSITGTAPEQVTEGRLVTYDLEITNKGPDPATDIALHAGPTFEFVSVTASQGICVMGASNVYCKFARLEKGQKISVKIVEQCRWGSYYKDAPSNYEQSKSIEVESSEGDPIYENSSITLLTKILEDPNKAPLAEIISPKMETLIVGPAATIKIAAKAWDPDGSVEEIEFFDRGVSIGKGALSGSGEYHLTYDQVSFGPHSLGIKVTDNLGRVTEIRSSVFFVNGPAKVNITNPKEGSLFHRVKGEIPVTIQASHPNGRIKEVVVYFSELRASYGSGEPKATFIGNDTYIARLNPLICKRHCQVRAVAIDDDDIETRSEPVNFRIAEPPQVILFQYDGKYLRRITQEEPFDTSRGLILVAEAEHRLIQDLKIVKVDFLADDQLICSYTKSDPDYNDNRFIQCDLKKLSIGRHKLQAIATDSDGSLGKSELIEILLKPR